MHLYTEGGVAIGRALEYYALAAQAFTAGIKCRHCTLIVNRQCAVVPPSICHHKPVDTHTHELSGIDGNLTSCTHAKLTLN